MDAYEFAVQLIEKDTGRSFRNTETTEKISVSNSFVRLKTPLIKILNVVALKRDWEHGNIFGRMKPTEILLTDIETTSDGIILPQTIWGSYDEATVTYVHGYSEIPKNVEEAANIIAEQLIDAGQISGYSALLLLRSEHIESLLQPYRSN